MKNTLSPAELFDYRLAALLRYTDPEAMKRTMPYRAYLGWQRLWRDDPWGPWRDNFHIAVLAREIRRGGNLKRHFYTSPQSKVKEEESGFIAILGASATKVSPKEAQRRFKTAKRKRKKRDGGPGKTSRKA